jgi:two-component system response regulator WspF
MRIAIVNDMVMIVELLKRIVTSNPDHQIVWVAYDGAEAVQRCAADTPDLILMDLIMPVMGGVEATYHIMQQMPCAILIVTASVMGNISRVFEAMGHGALDVIRTPSLKDGAQSEGAIELLQKITTIGRLIGHMGIPHIGKSSAPPQITEPPDALPALIVLGASTGGPLALTQVLSHLPPDFPGALIVIQHVDSHFIGSFVEWLGERCALPVHVAKVGDAPTRGVVFVAGTNEHLILTSARRFAYTSQPLESIYCPSVDVFFQSVKKHWPNPGIAAILTGMGKDGANGLLALAEVGWVTIAQARDGCMVYGMPKAAVDIRAAQEVLPLNEIGPRIVACVDTIGEQYGRRSK